MTRPDVLPPENISRTRARHISFSASPLFVSRVLVELFSGVGKRDPPSEYKTQHIRLITIGVSHFCEKVRWGLDLLEADPLSPIYYSEDAHPPPFASFASVPASGDKASQTPMIVMNSGTMGQTKVLYSSTTILRELCPFLYPAEIEHEIVKFEGDMGTRLGATARCVAYHGLLAKENHPTIVKICGANTSKIESFLFEKMLDRGVARVMRKLIHVNETTASASEVVLREVFKEVSDRLEENGGNYLMDTPGKSYGLTAADLTFAALAYPIVRPPELKQILPSDESEIPARVRDFSKGLRDSRAGQHALRMYAKHRLSGGASEVVMKTIGRNESKLKRIGVYALGAVGIAAAAVALAKRK